MIYTLGNKVHHEQILKGIFKKIRGATVWKTFNDANEVFQSWYLKEPDRASQFTIYLVDADWDTDTTPDHDGSKNQHTLKKSARMSIITEKRK